MVTCCERADHLALVCDVLLYFCHFPVCYTGSSLVTIVSISDLCQSCNIVESKLKYYENNNSVGKQFRTRSDAAILFGSVLFANVLEKRTRIKSV